MKLDPEKVTQDIEKADTASEAGPLKVWIDPVLTELEISRTAHNPALGSDGGIADCQHI